MKKDLGIFILLIALCGCTALLNPRFLSVNNLVNMARLVGIMGIYSIGAGLVIVTAGIDLSVGSLFALQGVLLALMLSNWGWPWPLAVAATVAGATALGVLHGFLIARVRMQAFIVTLCGLLFYRGIARYITKDMTVGFGIADFGPLRALASGNVYSLAAMPSIDRAGEPIRNGVPMPFIIMIVVAVAMWLVLHRSVYGRYLMAVGRNEDAARYSGIPTRLVIGSAYVVASFLTGVSGILFAFYTNSIQPSSQGNFYELYGIAAAVLGGCSLRGGEGSIIGIIIGTALLQVLQNLVNLLGIPSSLNFAVMGFVILVGVLADQLIAERRRKRLGAKQAAK